MTGLLILITLQITLLTEEVMATISFYVRHVLKDEKKIEELLEALNDPNAGISINREEVKRTLQKLEEGEERIKEWIDQLLLSCD